MNPAIFSNRIGHIATRVEGYSTKGRKSCYVYLEYEDTIHTSCLRLHLNIHIFGTFQNQCGKLCMIFLRSVLF